MSNNKSEKSTTPPANLIMNDIFYQIILIIGDSVLLG